MVSVNAGRVAMLQLGRAASWAPSQAVAGCWGAVPQRDAAHPAACVYFVTGFK